VRISNETITGLMVQVRESRHGWNGPAGRELLGLLRQNLSAVALRNDRPVDDAVLIAWEELERNPGLLAGSVESICGVLRYRVVQRLREAGRAERLMISEIDHRKAVAAEGVVVDGLPQRAAEIPAVVHETPSAALRLVSTRLAVALLVESGLTDSQSHAVVDCLLDAAASGGEGTTVNARRRVVASAELGVHLGLTPKAWSAIASLLLGSKRGNAGLIEAELAGAEAPSAIVRTARQTLGLAP
jgi:hypothetical protein